MRPGQGGGTNGRGDRTRTGGVGASNLGLTRHDSHDATISPVSWGLSGAEIPACEPVAQSSEVEPPNPVSARLPVHRQGPIALRSAIAAQEAGAVLASHGAGWRSTLHPTALAAWLRRREPPRGVLEDTRRGSVPGILQSRSTRVAPTWRHALHFPATRVAQRRWRRRTAL